jgi:Flp pilus assembly protein TadD
MPHFSGHPDQGLGLLKPLTETEDPDPAALYLLGVAYARAGQAQQAQDVFTKLFAGSATPAQANALLGHAYYDGAQFREAEQAYQAVLQADARCPALIANWARCTSACRKTRMPKSS